MAISTLDGFIASTKYMVQWSKTTTRTTVANSWFSLFDVAGHPGAGTLAGSSTAAGVVPTSSSAGYPLLPSFGGSNGYLGRVKLASTVACRIALFDRLFVCGNYAFNANTALSSQPSYSARLPGSIYSGLQLWIETVTAATGNQTWNVTYTDQSGNTGATTGAVGIGSAPTVGRCWQLPFASGDSGVQKIENVAGGTGSAGTANIMVLRPLIEGRIIVANSISAFSALEAGLVELYETSALYAMVCPDSTSSGLPDCSMQIAVG